MLDHRTHIECVWRFLVVLLVSGLPTSAAAQESVSLQTNVTIFGDNTEFFNPFRDGETLLVDAGSVAVGI